MGLPEMSEWVWGVLLALIVWTVIFTIAAVNWWRSFWASRKAISRSRQAMAGEEWAADCLTADGFTILSVQPKREWTVFVDGEPVSIGLRADFVVKRRNKLYVVDVKTGESAPSIWSAATRRQLLEYFWAYQADGVLLVDAESRQIREVSFAV